MAEKDPSFANELDAANAKSTDAVLSNSAQEAANDAWESLKRGSFPTTPSAEHPFAEEALSQGKSSQDKSAQKPAQKPAQKLGQECSDLHGKDPLLDDWESIRQEHQKHTAEQDAGISSEVQKLMLLSAIVAGALTLVAFVLSVLGVPFMRTFAPGFALGSTLATLNLGIMARATYGLFNKEAGLAVAAFLFSIGILLGGAVWVAVAKTPWLFGYCAGMALPAISGVWYAKRSVQAG